MLPATGPWRRDHETAQADGKAMKAAFYEGGASALAAVKNGFYNSLGSVAAPAQPAEKPPEAVPGGQVWEVETQKDGTEFRALCRFAKKVFYDNENKKRMTVTGPWRTNREQAERDAVGISDAYESGGSAEASKFKNELFKGAFNKKPSEPPAARPPPRRAEADSGDPRPEKKEAAGRNPAADEFVKSMFRSSGSMAEDEEADESSEAIADDRIEAFKGGFRAACKFEVQRDTSWGSSRKATDTLSITGPARSTAADAKADAEALERAYNEVGMQEVHRLKNELFRGAFKGKPDPATEKAHFNLGVAGSEGGEEQEAAASARSEVVADDRGRGFRASCGLPAGGGDGRHFNKNAIIPLVGPWRTSRAEAESDEAALLAAYRSGGIEAAQECKKDLRHNVLAAGGSAAVAAAAVTEKLSGDEMAERYGKGFLLAQRMGYGGAGLGREEQGRDMLVSLDGARSSVGAGARLGLGVGSGGGGARLETECSDEEEAAAAQPPAAGFTSGGLLGHGEDSQRLSTQVKEEYEDQKDDGNTDDEQEGDEEMSTGSVLRMTLI